MSLTYITAKVYAPCLKGLCPSMDFVVAGKPPPLPSYKYYSLKKTLESHHPLTLENSLKPSSDQKLHSPKRSIVSVQWLGANLRGKETDGQTSFYYHIKHSDFTKHIKISF